MAYATSVRELLLLSDHGPAPRGHTFTGTSAHVPGGPVFGGQVLAQAVVAASRTVAGEREVRSLHASFLRSGDTAAEVAFEVDAIQDGRTVATRRVLASQARGPIFAATVSFQVPEDSVEHAPVMPADIPGPEGLPERVIPTGPAGLTAAEELIDVRDVPPGEVPPANAHRQLAWVRVRERLADDRTVQRAALAYLADAVIQMPVLLRHGVTWWTEGTAMASIDHAQWWYADGSADEWILAVQESPVARGGRGLATGQIFTREGILLAAASQEILFRVPPGVARS